MDKIIDLLAGAAEDFVPIIEEKEYEAAAQLLREARLLLQSLAAGEPAPAGTTYQTWAKELLA